MDRKVLIILLGIFCLGYLLRVLYLKDLSLTFGYDQARDAFVTQQILSGDLKILGPPASTSGLYHGILYNYLLVPAYLFGANPINAAYWFAFLNTLTIFVVFYLTFLLTKKTGPAFVASFLFAISFEATQYANWLSNPTIGVWTVSFIYLGLWAWIAAPSAGSGQGKWWGSILTGLGLGLSIQAEVFLLYHAVPVLLWLFVARRKIKRKDIFKFLIFCSLAVSTMIVGEIKFGFRSIGGVLQLLSSQDSLVAGRGLGDFVVLFLNQLGKVFAYSTYPGNIGYGGVFVLVLIILGFISWRSTKKNSISNVSWQPFLITWLLSHLMVVSVGGISTPFLLVGIGTAVSIFVGIHIYNWWVQGKKILAGIILVIIVFGNLGMIFKENPKGQTIFAIQKDMLLSKQLKAIDYTYAESHGNMFSINSLTSPLWINIVWDYLYKWYGLEKYGYIPGWHGKDQVGQLSMLPKTESDTSIYFLIIEPMAGIPVKYLPETIAEEDGVSKLIEEKSFGELIVQKRERFK